MESTRLLLFQGAIAYWAEEGGYNEDLRAAGVSPEAFKLLRQKRRWRGGHAEIARKALDGCISVAAIVGGFSRFNLTGEHVAVAIATYVSPANWEGAAYHMAGATVNGTQLIAISGDRVEAIEHLPADKLFAMVQTAYAMQGEMRDERDDLPPEHEDAKGKVKADKSQKDRQVE